MTVGRYIRKLGYADLRDIKDELRNVSAKAAWIDDHRRPPSCATSWRRTPICVRPSTEGYAALPGYLIGADLIAGAGLGRETFDGVGAGRVAALAGARGCVTALATIRRGAEAVGAWDITGFGASAA
jgi:hypothetical protein